MVVSHALRIVSPFVPVAGSAYGFAKTCVKVYKATSPTKALVAGVKGDPNFAVGTFECCNAIVEG